MTTSLSNIEIYATLDELYLKNFGGSRFELPNYYKSEVISVGKLYILKKQI